MCRVAGNKIIGSEYDKLSLMEKQHLSNWICSKFKKSRKIYWDNESYGLKHVFERDGGFYICDETFRDAMGRAGFIEVAKKNEIFAGESYYYKMEELLPHNFYNWCVKKYRGKDSPFGDLANDIKTDPYFPKDSVSKDEILGYLDYASNCSSSVMEVFEAAWAKFKRVKF